MKGLLFEVLDRATKNNMEFLICDNQDGTVFMSQRKKATEKQIQKMYKTWDIGECFILFPKKNKKYFFIYSGTDNDYYVDFDTFEGKYLLWTELSEKENRISDGSSSLWDILGLDKLYNEWSNFYKYL
tara:strand:- start:289 stop:672 length:384 start_codon:yes stop_codon:yes gene_type:complete